MRTPGSGLPTAPTVVVLAGGSARRFGGDKLAAPLGGSTVLGRLLAALPAAWPVIGVGPDRPTDRAVRWVREEPPGGGPLAAVAAAVPQVTTPLVVVLAGDMPDAARALPDLLAALLDAPPADVGAVAVDPGGTPNPLLSAWRTTLLADRIPRPAANRPARLLLDLPHVRVPVDAAAAHDVDTRADLEGRHDLA